jgi:hypothetical protein
MRRATLAVLALTLAFAIGGALARAADVPLIPGAGDLQLVPLSGIQAKLEQGPDVAAGEPGVKVTFTKTGEERRFLALEARPAGDLTGAKALALQYRLQLKSGEGLRSALMVYDQEGAWYRVGANPLRVGELSELRIPVTGLTRTAFTPELAEELDWGTVEKVWFGAVIDGPAEGALEIREAYFTSEPYRPTEPIRVTGEGPGTWTLGKDAAVQATLTTPNEGPDGKPCMKLEFTFPGGRHMYCVPSTPVPEVELEGYIGLRFTYKASLPPGIEGLLVMLGESGGQFVADPAPKRSDDWTTITLLFSDFQLGNWSKDDNGQLDLNKVSAVFIACHGTATGAGGPGTIWVTDIEFVP